MVTDCRGKKIVAWQIAFIPKPEKKLNFISQMKLNFYISSYVNDEGKTIYKWSDERGILLSGYTSIKTTNGGNNLAIGAMSSIELNAAKVMQNGKRLLNEADLDSLKAQIHEIEKKIAGLES